MLKAKRTQLIKKSEISNLMERNMTTISQHIIPCYYIQTDAAMTWNTIRHPFELQKLIRSSQKSVFAPKQHRVLGTGFSQMRISKIVLMNSFVGSVKFYSVDNLCGPVPDSTNTRMLFDTNMQPELDFPTQVSW